MKLLYTLLMLFTFSLFANSKNENKVIYTYSKNVEGNISESNWSIQKKDDKTWHIEGESPGAKTLIIASPTQINTQSFAFKSKVSPIEYTIDRFEKYLSISSLNNGKNFHKKLYLNGDTWVQEFDFSFKPFILSNHNEFRFSIVNPKKLNLHAMVAKKLGDSQLEIGGKKYLAQKVKVTLRGFKKMFWHANLWYEKETGDLIKYEANEGPNTPTSIITLVKKQLL